MKMKTSTYEVSAFIALKRGIPRTFVAAIRHATPKALWLYGHGVVADTVRCVRCARELTHPVSRLCGIGPECVEHFWDESVLGPYGFTEEHAEILRRMVHEAAVDCWVPKSCIKRTEPTDEEIDVPPPPKKDEAEDRREPQRGRQKKAAELDESGELVEVRFPYDAAMVDKVRTLAGRRWNPTAKHWTCALRKDNANALRDWGFQIGPRLAEWLRPAASPGGKACRPFEGTLGGLYPYQQDGVRYLEGHKGRALIADQMGLGKTAQALAYLERNRGAVPAVVVCPASVKGVWLRETERWTGLRAVVLSGRTGAEIPEGAQVIVLNWDIVEGWTPALKAAGIKTVIMDEAHYAKNPKTKRTKAVKLLCKGVRHVIALTGTPILNRPVEILTAVSLVSPGLFPSRWKFLQRYCGARHNGFGWDFSGASHTDELHKVLTENVMLRRLKTDVLTDLPPKVRSVVPISLNGAAAEYDRAERDFKGWLAEQGGSIKRTHALAKIETLKQLAVQLKTEQVIGWIEDFLATGGKLVLFCHHHKTVEALAFALGDHKPAVVDGSTPQAKRDGEVLRFQTDERCRLFIGTMAAKEGITLTAAAAVAFVELWWTPGDHAQAEDRIHRIGQHADSVAAYYLIAQGTIEERIARLLDKKHAVLDSVLDGAEPERGCLLTELLKEMSG